MKSYAVPTGSRKRAASLPLCEDTSGRQRNRCKTGFGSVFDGVGVLSTEHWDKLESVSAVAGGDDQSPAVGIGGYLKIAIVRVAVQTDARVNDRDRQPAREMMMIRNARKTSLSFFRCYGARRRFRRHLAGPCTLIL